MPTSWYSVRISSGLIFSDIIEALGSTNEISSPLIDISSVLSFERSIPAFIPAWQLIKILRSPILYQVWLSLALMILVMVYSTVASSLSSLSCNTESIAFSFCLQENSNIRPARYTQILIPERYKLIGYSLPGMNKIRQIAV